MEGPISRTGIDPVLFLHSLLYEEGLKPRILRSRKTSLYSEMVEHIFSADQAFVLGETQV